MKRSQRERYAEGIERVVDHLAIHAAEDPAPSLEALARLAHLSPFHFHRVYRLMTGETPAQTLRRLRLARSLPTLENGVTAAAGAAGYASSAAYTRALKGETGMTGRQAADPAERRALAERLRRPATAEGTHAIDVQVRSFEPFEVVAQRNLGPWEALNDAYTRLFDAVLTRVEPDRILGIWGVPVDDPSSVEESACRFDCALALDGPASQAPAPGLAVLRLGGGEVAGTVHRGAYEGLGSTLDALVLAVIDTLDRALGDAPPFVHYRHDPEETDEAELEAEIYVPLA